MLKGGGVEGVREEKMEISYINGNERHVNLAKAKATEANPGALQLITHTGN